MEETGLGAAGVEVLASLAALAVPVSNHRVTPVLAWWTQPTPVAVVDPGETASVPRPGHGPARPENRRTTAPPPPHGYRTPAFVYGEHLVWGFTGIVLARMFDALGWAEPSDRRRTVDVPG